MDLDKKDGKTDDEEFQEMMRALECEPCDIDVNLMREMIYKPWMSNEKKYHYRLGFDPETIAVLAASRAKRNGGGGREDLSFMIKLGVDLGDDLAAVSRALKPDRAREFRRLSTVYGLVSGPPLDSETALTLYRLSLAHPTITCEYLHNRPWLPRRRGRSVVSSEKMEAISPGYPSAMMTYAFAFVIPNRAGDAYELLMKAHMLHEYESKGPSVNARFTFDQEDHKDKMIVCVVKRTLAAIAASCVEYEQQMAFLERMGLVRVTALEGTATVKGTATEEGTATVEGTATEEGTASVERTATEEGTSTVEGTVTVAETVTEDTVIVVAEHVVAAARIWEKKDKRKLTELFLKHFFSR